jgi:hypothetical protein
VTTKDILKRYGDISRKPPPKQHTIVTNSPPQSRECSRPPSTPVFHRVDSDITQSVAWQRESSARPSGGPPPTVLQQPTQSQQLPPKVHTKPTYSQQPRDTVLNQRGDTVLNDEGERNAQGP